MQLKVDETRMGGPFWNGGIATRNNRMGGHISAIDMTTGKVKVILVFTATLDGTITAFDDESLEPLWSFNVGTSICAPPMSYSVGGKQFVALHVGGGVPWNIGVLKGTPELHTLEGGSSLFVFALD